MLDDQQLLQFLCDGYLILQPETLTTADHDHFYQRAADLYGISSAVESQTAHLDILGDNLRAQVPEIDRLLTDPVIDDALTAIVGPDYVVHPHSYCHRSGERDQPFHQDGNLPWNERAHHRSHRPEWAILFYYPHGVTAEQGPTEILPGSQYWTVDHETEDGGWHPGDRVDRSIDDAVLGGTDLELRDLTQQRSLERGLGVPDLARRFLELPAGTAVITHYDLFHRGSRVNGQPPARYMYKFNLVRVHDPASPARAPGAPDGPGDRPPRRLSNLFDARTAPTEGSLPVRAETRPVVEANWRWLHGDGGDDGDGGGQVESDVDVGALTRRLREGREDQKVEAAYLLGSLAASVVSDRDDPEGAKPMGPGMGPAALLALREGLMGDDEGGRRAAGHGLRQAGATGVPVLLDAIGTEEDDGACPVHDAPVRRPAVAALSTRAAAHNESAVAALIRAVRSDEDDLVRSNAAYSLGHLARFPAVDGDRIATVLLDRLEPGVEPHNAFSVSFPRSTVRQSLGYALTLVLANHRLSDEVMDRVVDGPLQDDDRYVQGLVVEGLARAPHLPADAGRRITRYLAGRRWNPSPAV